MSTNSFQLHNFVTTTPQSFIKSTVKNAPKRRCDGCEQRRKGCDGNDPCSRCERLSSKCTYSPPAKQPAPIMPTSKVAWQRLCDCCRVRKVRYLVSFSFSFSFFRVYCYSCVDVDLLPPVLIIIIIII